MRRLWHWLAIGTLIALILLSLGWELWLAPLRPGGSMLALKAVLLLAPLFGILRGRLYTFQWSSMFILLFFTEGIMRGWADHGLSQQLAWGETALSVLFFVAVIGFIRSRQ
ncbi:MULTISPECIES: DUF2069 domain-containing protein [unclassified Paludibacterium]|uniref:DUF2069 domain-containing protein n=1 Tax=unclassified Paludibacterium TaxID=2618429 RepID=UPI001C059856|nr:DUF2069 domain-containing protein [Paludibacterium sp. B53371]BEV72930.1 hypothetical protein THUN1379_24120 [Paludibacterium sp. THUN1379]